MTKTTEQKIESLIKRVAIQLIPPDAIQQGIVPDPALDMARRVVRTNIRKASYANDLLAMQHWLVGYEGGLYRDQIARAMADEALGIDVEENVRGIEYMEEDDGRHVLEGRCKEWAETQGKKAPEKIKWVNSYPWIQRHATLLVTDTQVTMTLPEPFCRCEYVSYWSGANNAKIVELAIGKCAEGLFRLIRDHSPNSGMLREFLEIERFLDT